MNISTNSAGFINNPGQSDHNIDSEHRGKTKGKLAGIFDSHGFKASTPVRTKELGEHNTWR